MSLKQKIQQIRNSESYQENKLYLLEHIKGGSGFLFGNDKLFFAVRSIGLESESIQTAYLAFRTNVYINTVENTPSFLPGEHDLLVYSGNIEESFFDSFVELCRMYASKGTDISFSDFFYSLIKLFEIPKETSYTNLIGFFGELVFMKTLQESYNIVTADNWHNSLGTFDKYDFSFPTINVEIKTTSKETMSFEIKHNQLFNENRNYAVVIQIQNDNSGLSVSDLFDYFKNEPTFSSNINFWIKMQNEKMKINPQDFSSKRFSVNKMLAFLNKNLETITDIPECIEKVKYDYNFALSTPYDFSKMVSEMNEGIKKA